jgi:prepilin-type N-terminal cleavage/methylation domain-containing protein
MKTLTPPPCLTGHRARRKFDSRPLRSGLSLIEVLVSLALSAVLLTSVYSAITMYFHYSTSGQDEVEKNQLARVLLQRIETDLRSIVYRPEDKSTTATDDSDAQSGANSQNAASGTGGTSTGSTTDTAKAETVTAVQDPSDAFTGSSSGLFGNTQTIVLHISRPRLDLVAAPQLNNQMVGSRTSDLKTVSYFVAGSSTGGLQALAAAQFATQTQNGTGRSQGLARMEGDRLALQLADKSGNLASLLGQTQLLAPEVIRANFRFWDGSNWAVTWDSATYGGLPRAVEVTLELDFNVVQPFRSRFKKQKKQEATRTYRSVIALPISKPIIQSGV